MAVTNTGIVRRIDDLGRVVIPRDIRRSLGIVEGDLLEIRVDKDANSVIFAPYAAESEVERRLDALDNVLCGSGLGEEFCGEIRSLMTRIREARRNE